VTLAARSKSNDFRQPALHFDRHAATVNVWAEHDPVGRRAPRGGGLNDALRLGERSLELCRRTGED